MPRARSIALLSLVVLLAAIPARPASSAASAGQSPGLLLTGARIVDGTGTEAFQGAVWIRDGRVAGVFRGDEAPDPDFRGHGQVAVVDLDGLVLAPGFIDIHNHSTNRIDDDPAATTQVAQGVTTIVVGADGSSPWPIDEYLDEIAALDPAINVATMVGHGTVRGAVLGDDFRREATDEEIRAMAERVRQGMEAGAFGLSSGLEYDPGFYASTEELIALARVAAEHGGFYASHMRDEEEGVLDAIDEAIRIGQEAGLPVQISHIKMGNASVWGRADDALARIAAARDRGLDVTADQYPYTAWQSGLGIVVRSRKFDDPDEVAAGLAALGGADRLQITHYEPDPSVNGMRLSEIADREGRTPTRQYIEMMRQGGAEVIGHTMTEEDVEALMTSPWVMTASDGGIGSSHPRGAGAFARVLAVYARDKGLLSLPRAIARGTSQPARRLGLEDRGVIREGAVADLVAFDPERIADRSTFLEPLIPATGVHATWVGGVRIWRDGATTGARPGKVLRHDR